MCFSKLRSERRSPMAEPRKEFTLDFVAREVPVMMQLRACAVCGYLANTVGHMCDSHSSYHEFVPVMRALSGPDIEQIKRLLDSPDSSRVFSMLSPISELEAAFKTIEALEGALREWRNESAGIGEQHFPRHHFTTKQPDGSWLPCQCKACVALAAFDAEVPHA